MTILSPQPAPAVPQGIVTPLPRLDPITRLPILILFPHSRCNCRCVMCDIWRDTTKTELAASDVARWVDEWRALGVQRVVLSGGEALLHSQLWALCDVLRAADIGITILSTGLLLRRHAAELVLRCDDVVVSLDGPQAIHDAIRNVPRAFERLAEGVAAVKGARRSVLVTGRCTVQRSNFANLREIVAAAHTIGLDRISFLAADVSSDAFNRPGGWDGERVGSVALERDDLPMLCWPRSSPRHPSLGALLISSAVPLAAAPQEHRWIRPQAEHFTPSSMYPNSRCARNGIGRRYL